MKKIIIAVIVLVIVYGFIGSCLTKAGNNVISKRNQQLESLYNN